MSDAGELAREHEALRQRLFRPGQPAHQREPAVAAPGDDGPSQAFVAGEIPCSLNRWLNPKSSLM